MTKPREVLPGQFYFLTRRCTQHQFLLRPDEETNNAYSYCLGVAAERFEIELIHTLVESNHHHTAFYDRFGRCPEFVAFFHMLLARSQNALRGRVENFWSSEEPCIVRLVDPATVIAKIIYGATNPVKDRLVERVHHWPGVNATKNLLRGLPLRASRPRHFFRAPGPMPESVTLHFRIPPELGLEETVLKQIREGIEEVEKRVAADRGTTGARVVGRRRILEQSWRGSPPAKHEPEPRRSLRPRFAASDPTSRIAALNRYRAFLEAYDDAMRRWRLGEQAVFPHGTYWMRRFAAVPVGPPPQFD